MASPAASGRVAERELGRRVRRGEDIIGVVVAVEL